jgi:hypothetical protein
MLGAAAAGAMAGALERDEGRAVEAASTRPEPAPEAPVLAPPEPVLEEVA